MRLGSTSRCVTSLWPTASVLLQDTRSKSSVRRHLDSHELKEAHCGTRSVGKPAARAFTGETRSMGGLAQGREFIHHTARSIAAETAGFEQEFRLPQQGDLKLLHAARAAVQDAAPDAAAFIKHARPERQRLFTLKR